MNEQVAKRVLAKIQGFLNKKHSWGRFILRWQPGVHSVLPLGGHSEGNRYTLYTTGDDAFAAKWESIKKAKEKVWCSVYTIEPDRVGQHTVDLLVQAKKRGCRVILLYDYIGSHRISHNFLEPLYSVGAECIQFSPIHVTRYESWRNGIFRSHQKLLIADEHGFCGTFLFMICRKHHHCGHHHDSLCRRDEYLGGLCWLEHLGKRCLL